MSALALTSRKTQLALLERACRARCAARITLSGSGRAGDDWVQTRFRALEPDALVMQWPSGGTGSVAPDGATVDVFFHDADRLLGFRSETRGRVSIGRDGAAPRAAWKLAIPLCVEPREQRRHARIRLDGARPVHALCTSVLGGERRFATVVHDLSRGGFQASASVREAGWTRPGDLFWASFALPGALRPVEFVARVAHLRTCETEGTVLLGCRFCPVDDATEHNRHLARLWQFLVGLGSRPPAHAAADQREGA